MTQPSPFHKVPECDRCQFFSNSAYLRCTVHPLGQSQVHCPDFQEDTIDQRRQSKFLDLDWVDGEEFQDVPVYENPFSDDEAQWEPEGASYYAGELIVDAVQRFTTAQKRELLDWHPIFTGRCPECERTISVADPPQIHWHCEACGWKDNSI